ncbi:hypothetical protein [Streptomyces sp. NPDC002994]|uniref:hypothetical protein n=1 Tax=Streptomyces sp. NPDC002994 TaxID=3154441 RepID=UPI0033AEC98B
MAQTYEVISVTEYFPNPDTPCWMVTMRRPDNGLHQFLFPQATLAHRAAEYGIDAADTDTLLDIVLHEQFAPHPEDPVTAADDPVAKAGLRSPAVASRGTVRVGDLVPTTLYTASTTAEARVAHLMRIEHAKTHVVRVAAPSDAQAADPLDVIRRTPVDAAAVTKLRARVDENRRRLQGERIPRQPERALPYDTAADHRTANMTKEATRA